MLIELAIIASIESSGYEKAINFRTKAYGLYQITQPALDDFCWAHGVYFELKEMLEKDKARRVAEWYLNIKIPQYLAHYGFPDTETNRLIAWNWGIGNLKRAKKTFEPIPKETIDFVFKYQKLKEKKCESMPNTPSS